jgi:BRCA1-associated protein
MNVENGRVWDFAGDGYVHRLIMQQSDNDYDRGNDNVGLRASSAEERVQTKMVEIPDPRSRVSSRTRQAPLSTDEESLLVNRKLESTAFHYNQILTWQLETNRQQYEDRLRRFKDFLKQELQLASSSSTTNSSSSGSSNNNAKDNSKSWSQTVEELLLQEKTKALKKRDVAYGRLEDARAELRLLKDFNTSLGSNVADLHIAVAAAADKVSQAERVYSDFIPKLEKKVQALMERL